MFPVAFDRDQVLSHFPWSERDSVVAFGKFLEEAGLLDARRRDDVGVERSEVVLRKVFREAKGRSRSCHQLNSCLVPFKKKIIDLPGGRINDPSSGKHYFLLFLPATPSSLSQTLEGAF